MGYLAIASAAAAMLAVYIPGFGKYVAIGLGIFAIGAGLVGYRRGRPRARLSGAGGIALGLTAFLLGVTKVGLTLMAMNRLENLFP